MPLIKEIKATCLACGNIWYFGKTEESLAAAADMQNLGKSLMCCGGCWPAVFIPDAKKTIDPNKCPKCNSQAIKKEEVVHEV